MAQFERFSSTQRSFANPERNIRPKPRFLLHSKSVYMTEGQIQSTDNTNTTSEKTLIKLEYESRLSRLQKENAELREIVAKIKTSQYYELDEQKIRSIIKQNEIPKVKIIELQQHIKMLSAELEATLVENEYLKRNNDALKKDFEKLIKQNIRQKHSYIMSSSKRSLLNSRDCGRLDSDSASDSEQFVQLIERNKTRENDIRRDIGLQLQQSKEKYKPLRIQNQKLISSTQKLGKKMKFKSKLRIKSSKKSGDMLLASRQLVQRHVKNEVTQTNDPTTVSQIQLGNTKSSKILFSGLKNKQKQSSLRASHSRNSQDEGKSDKSSTKKKTQFGLRTSQNDQYYHSQNSQRQPLRKTKSIYYGF